MIRKKFQNQLKSSKKYLFLPHKYGIKIFVTVLILQEQFSNVFNFYGF